MSWSALNAPAELRRGVKFGNFVSASTVAIIDASSSYFFSQ